jgi:putative chitinase
MAASDWLEDDHDVAIPEPSDHELSLPEAAFRYMVLRRLMALESKERAVLRKLERIVRLLERWKVQSELLRWAASFAGHRRVVLAVRRAPHAAPMIDAGQLRQIMPVCPLARAQTFLEPLNNAMLAFAIMDTMARQAAFLAQVAHESCELRYMRELADGHAYEGRKDLGNTQPGDGHKFRGGGPIELTGRDNFRRFSLAYYGDERLLDHAELIEQPDIGCAASAWFWQGDGFNQLADLGQFDSSPGASTGPKTARRRTSMRVLSTGAARRSRWGSRKEEAMQRFLQWLTVLLARLVVWLIDRTVPVRLFIHHQKGQHMISITEGAPAASFQVQAKTASGRVVALPPGTALAVALADPTAGSVSVDATTGAGSVSPGVAASDLDTVLTATDSNPAGALLPANEPVHYTADNKAVSLTIVPA